MSYTDPSLKYYKEHHHEDYQLQNYTYTTYLGRQHSLDLPFVKDFVCTSLENPPIHPFLYALAEENRLLKENIKNLWEKVENVPEEARKEVEVTLYRYEDQMAEMSTKTKDWIIGDVDQRNWYLEERYKALESKLNALEMEVTALRIQKM